MQDVKDGVIFAKTDHRAEGTGLKKLLLKALDNAHPKVLPVDLAVAHVVIVT